MQNHRSRLSENRSLARYSLSETAETGLSGYLFPAFSFTRQPHAAAMTTRSRQHPRPPAREPPAISREPTSLSGMSTHWKAGFAGGTSDRTRVNSQPNRVTAFPCVATPFSGPGFDTDDTLFRRPGCPFPKISTSFPFPSSSPCFATGAPCISLPFDPVSGSRTQSRPAAFTVRFSGTAISH